MFTTYHVCHVQGERGGVEILVDSHLDYLKLARELHNEGFVTSYYREDHSPLFTYFHHDELPEVFRHG